MLWLRDELFSRLSGNALKQINFDGEFVTKINSKGGSAGNKKQIQELSCLLFKSKF
jgi:hypothetical protein